MKVPLSLSVASPSVRSHSSALATAATLVVLQVGITLLRPWPLALAVDHALGGKPLTGPLEFLAGMQPALLLAFDPGLLAIGLAVVPILAGLAVRQRARIRAAQQDARAESGRLAGATTDLLRNVRAVQAFGRIDYATEQFGRQNDAVLDVE